MELVMSINQMAEVALAKRDDFLKIKETLTRIGIASDTNQTLYQSCHILHKRGRYYIVHFKELFILDGKQANITQDDYHRRNYAVKLLCDWKLCTPINFEPSMIELGTVAATTKVLKFEEKMSWILKSKHSLGRN